MLVIDGPSRTISLDANIRNYTASFLYSRWKEWVQHIDNAKYLEAFRSVGGDDLGGGARSPAFIFVRNDYGWRIQKPASNAEFRITGNLLGHDPSLDTLSEPVGDFSPTIRILQNNVTQNITQQATETGSCLHVEVHEAEYIAPQKLELSLIQTAYHADLSDASLDAELVDIFDVALIEPKLNLEAICPC